MTTKFLEIRDRATCIPALAIKLTRESHPIASHAGFGEVGSILLINLAKPSVQYDPYAWNPMQGRTMIYAHHEIEKRWDTLVDGSVVDVEFLGGETTVEKTAELVRRPNAL